MMRIMSVKWTVGVVELSCAIFKSLRILNNQAYWSSMRLSLALA